VLDHQWFYELVELADLVVEIEDPPSEGPHGDPGSGGWVVVVVEVTAPGGDGAQHLHAGQRADGVAYLIGCGDRVVPQQLQGFDAGADGSGPG
jgi:hypothetical protein